jgi:hypothetical protein
MPKRKLSITALSLLLICYCLPIVAEDKPYYMWTDPSGVVNFSDIKPLDRDSTEFSDPPEFGEPFNDDDGSSPGYVPPEAAVNETARALNCLIGQRMLSKLQSYKNIFMKDDEGWWRQLSEQSRQQKVDDAFRIIDENCEEAAP